MSAEPKQVPGEMVDVRVNNLAINIPKQSSKTAAETRPHQAAWMNMCSQSRQFVVQSPGAARQRGEVELELVQRILAKEVDGAQFGTTAIHSTKDVKDCGLLLLQL